MWIPKGVSLIRGPALIRANIVNRIVIQFTCHTCKISTHAFTETLATVEVFQSADNVDKNELAKLLLTNLTV